MLDKLSEDVETISKDVKELSQSVRELREEGKAYRDEQKELSIRFSSYQMASQWVVNLAFGLLATATITTIITAVVK